MKDYNASTWNYTDDQQTYRLIRSIDNGKTWTPISVTGITDRKTYGLSANAAGIVVAVTGDRGNPCIISSTDFGVTWATRVTTAQLGTTGALYNSYWSEKRGLFIVPSANVWTSADGVIWTKKTSYSIPVGRNGYIINNKGKEEIWVCRNSGGLDVLREGTKSTVNIIPSETGLNLTSFRDLGKGVLLASAGFTETVTRTQKIATVLYRKDNILYLTINNHGLTNDYYISSNFPVGSTQYAVAQSGMPVKVVDINNICVYQYGPDLSKITGNYSFIAALGKGIRIYRSPDYGNTWTSQIVRSVIYDQPDCWSRDFINLGNGRVVLGIGGFENYPDNNCGAFLLSVDYGKTWKITHHIAGKDNRKLHACYRSFVCEDGTVLAGCQNECRILRIY